MKASIWVMGKLEPQATNSQRKKQKPKIVNSVRFLKKVKFE